MPALRPTSAIGALFLHVHPPPIAHTHCAKGPSICANHTATAVKSAIIISLQVTTGCRGVMSVCANQSSLPRHNFGGSLAKTVSKGGISNSRYTRFERAYLIGCPSSNAGVVSPDVPQNPIRRCQMWMPDCDQGAQRAQYFFTYTLPRSLILIA